MTQHKWHKEIKAWADGAVIEWTFRGLCEWHTDTRPDWADGRCDFRIKPQPKEPKYLYVHLFNGTAMLTESRACASGGRYIGKIEVQDD
jgi:hypothetical protein